MRLLKESEIILEWGKISKSEALVSQDVEIMI